MAAVATEAVAYYRTSSAANVAGDSLARQQEAVRRYAKDRGLRIVAEFHDPGVSGKDPIDTRPGFSALLDMIEENGVRTVVVEDPSRFARELITQELGVVLMIQRGVRVFTASGENLTDTDDPARVMMRQVAAAFAQYEKERLVRKLRAARERKRAEVGRCGGARPVPPEVVAEARKLARRNPKTHERRSLREIAKELAARGYVTRSGRPYGAESIRRMLTGGRR